MNAQAHDDSVWRRREPAPWHALKSAQKNGLSRMHWWQPTRYASSAASVRVPTRQRGRKGEGHLHPATCIPCATFRFPIPSRDVRMVPTRAPGAEETDHIVMGDADIRPSILCCLPWCAESSSGPSAQGRFRKNGETSASSRRQPLSSQIT